jgi:chromosomal replication initiation ATPase DnaA
MRDQLVLPFGVTPALGLSDFVVAPCNQDAFRFIARWPDWPARAVALHGPRSSGKSHLARIWHARSGAHLLVSRELTAERIARLDAGIPVGVEDMDAAAPSADRDQALMALFERPGEVLFTGRTPPAQWPAAMGDIRSRFDALLVFPVWAPDDALLRNLMHKHFADRQLNVPEAAIERIVLHLERTPDAIADFVGKVDAKALSEKRAITERLVLELIAGEDKLKTGA